MAVSGFYKVSFSAELPGAGGIVAVTDGRVYGGDNQYLYSGTLTEEAGGKVTASITVKAFAPAAQSVFKTSGGKFSLDLSGTASDNGFTLTAPSPTGGKGISVIGAKVAELDLA